MAHRLVPQNRRFRRSNVLLTAAIEVSGLKISVKLRILSVDGALTEGEELPLEGWEVLFHRNDFILEFKRPGLACRPLTPDERRINALGGVGRDMMPIFGMHFPPGCSKGKLARKERIVRILLIIAVAAALPATAASLHAQSRTVEFETVPQDAAIDGTTQAHDTAIRRDGYDRMTVQVRLGGTGPYNFLVDTGSDRTALSRQLAAHLGLKDAGTARMHSVTGMSEVTTVMLPQLQLGGKNIEVARAPLLERENMGADGILGIDSLRAQRLLFDFPNRTMTIVPSAQRVSREERDAIIVVAKRRNGRLILTRARADGVPVTIILDTGSQVSIANEALRRELTRRRSLPQLGKVELQSVTGHELIGDYIFLKKLDLGEVTLANLVTVFAEAHTFKLLDLADRPAILLGMNALRGFERVSIDFERKQLRVIAPQRSERSGTMMAARAIEE